MLLCPGVQPCDACTSVIVSGKASPDGRPVMFKHRDAKAHPDNAVARFQGEKYAFIALVNGDWQDKVGIKGSWPEAWAGVNDAGFCIMNTATYDLKSDDVPAEQMDREGLVMYRALEICSSVREFEHFLDTLSRPRGVEANFGVIDAHGGAAYYEVDNWDYLKWDVNADPEGWRVVTNFTQSGRMEDRKGVDRYQRTIQNMSMPGFYTADDAVLKWKHSWMLNRISREGRPVLRDVTTSAVVFEGVRDGEDPALTVMWGCIGYPTAAPYIPLKVWSKDLVPDILRGPGAAPVCVRALQLKEEGGALGACRRLEEYIDTHFDSHFSESQYQKFIHKVEKRWRKYFRVRH